MGLVRVIAIGGSVVLAGLIVWAAFSAPFFESFGAIAAMPWGLVSLVDLYLGFALFSVLIAWGEGHAGRAVAWIVALFILGNIVAGLWLVLRAASLRARLAGS